MDDSFLAIPIIAIIFLALPALIFNFVLKLRQSRTLTVDDENLLDDLHDLARRLEDRVVTIERIMAAENPNWKTSG